jgi:hypothetical protein
LLVLGLVSEAEGDARFGTLISSREFDRVAGLAITALRDLDVEAVSIELGPTSIHGLRGNGVSMQSQ